MGGREVCEHLAHDARPRMRATRNADGRVTGWMCWNRNVCGVGSTRVVVLAVVHSACCSLISTHGPALTCACPRSYEMCAHRLQQNRRIAGEATARPDRVGMDAGIWRRLCTYVFLLQPPGFFLSVHSQGRACPPRLVIAFLATKCRSCQLPCALTDSD